MRHSPIFAPHGERNLLIEGKLFVIHSRGPWNVEFIQQGHTAVMKMAEAFASKPWMVLGLIYGDGLLTPDARATLVASIQAQQPIGRSGTALVLIDKPGSGFFTSFYRDMYAAANEPVEFFLDEASARAWLAPRLQALD